MQRRRDPDDPFDGTASGIFEPLEHDTRAPLIPLPNDGESRVTGRISKKSLLSQSHMASTSQLRTLLQSPKTQENRDKWTEQQYEQVPANRKSDFSEKLLKQGRQEVFQMVQTGDTQVRSSQPVEE